ncbi:MULTISPECIES: PQQ-dependent sugar dehydrogenase [unclassified Sinorhizobium]|uniref:PQQ-dependent sugar dehydrogenase n=1 Tax=unclassified Sinorhizobium TaxID=2613772 RepID=UPI0024C3DD51|nr:MULTISPECIES: PQQ-dependent sugar dehydrogenase [unclassified Sinorhizobium]MDK1374250.1 PQQ-dependent sugar dehydrogenase [Sinorhizobium sp. 6-70]MDK1478897.1 PQQ-dependent sugar dehydrogenase [Sinorhizobium sp. 6-117]
MDVFSLKAGFLSARMRFLALAALASGVALGPARAELLARVPAAREMAVCGDIVFVGTKGSSVYAVPLSGGGARRVASGFSAANGVACSGGRLFVASRDSVTVFDIGRGGDLSGRRDIRRGLPNSGAHSYRYIAVGPDSRLYVSLGSPCNICRPRGQQGTIVSMNQDGSNLRRVAWGVRNSVGFDWRGGTMFFTDNGADRMGDDVPPDELNALRPGGFYGFPYFGGQTRLKGFEDASPPERQIPPVFDFQAHVAALGIHFFRSLGGDALVAQHGSWDRSVPVGYQVVRVRFRGARPVSATTFLRDVGRPVDVKEAPDGSVLVSDDAGGAIYIFR